MCQMFGGATQCVAGTFCYESSKFTLICQGPGASPILLLLLCSASPGGHTVGPRKFGTGCGWRQVWREERIALSSC